MVLHHCARQCLQIVQAQAGLTHTMVLHPRPHLRGVLTIEHRRRTPELDKPSKRRHKEHKTAEAYWQNSNTDIGTYAEPKQFERPGGAVEKNN